MEIRAIAHLRSENAHENAADVQSVRSTIDFDSAFENDASIFQLELGCRLLVTYGLKSAEADGQNSSKSALKQLGHAVLKLEGIEKGEGVLLLHVSGCESFEDVPLFDIVSAQMLEIAPVQAAAAVASEVSASDKVESKALEAGATQVVKAEPLPNAEKASSSLIIPLIIGVVLVIVACGAMIGSLWKNMHEIARIASVLGLAAVFYGAFALSHFKLKLESAAKAFYLLGAASIALTIIVCEISIWGKDGDHAALALILPFLSVLGASVVGYLKLYRSAAFETFAWIGGVGTLSSICYAICESLKGDLMATAFGKYIGFYNLESIPWAIMVVITSGALIVMALLKRECSKVSLICAYLACIVFMFNFLAENGFGDHGAFSVIPEAIMLVATALLLKKYPGVWLILAMWGLSICVGASLEDGGGLPEEFFGFFCAACAVGCSYLMPAIGKKLSDPVVHKIVYWLSLIGTCFSVILTAAIGKDIYALLFTVPAVLSIFAAYKFHYTRYLISFSVISVISVSAAFDVFKVLPWWLSTLLVGGALIGTAIFNEVKHRQSESLAQKGQEVQISVWKW